MINEVELDLSPDDVTFLDRGADSSVYQYGDRVVKVYNQEVKPETLELYKTTTNKIANYLERIPFVGKFQAPGIPSPLKESYSYSVHVNPILYTGHNTKFDALISISEYIPGPSIWNFTYPHLQNGLISAIENLYSAKEQELLQQLASGNYYSYCAFGNVLQNIYMMEEELGSCFGVEGISTVQSNIKVRCNKADQIDFVITDLCGYLQGLRRYTD